MKKLQSKFNTKTLSIFFITIISTVFIFTIASLFVNNKNNNTMENDETILNEYNQIFIDSEIKKQNLYLLTNVNEKSFSKLNIEKELSKITKNAIKNNKDFKYENIDDYHIKIRYFLTSNQKELKVNTFLYNKIIKNKKFKTFYKIIIV